MNLSGIATHAVACLRVFFCLVTLVVLSACGGGSGGGEGGVGGGGGGGGSTSAPSSSQLDARVYSGHYVSKCSPTSVGSNYENGRPLYAKLVFTISSYSAGPVADLSGRFDFYDDNACTGTAQGAVTYVTGTSHFYLIAEKAVTGGTGHKVVLELMPRDTNYSAGPTADTVLLGSVLRLKIPKTLATGFYVSDIWRLQGNDLYDGDSANYDSQGFPMNLSGTAWAGKVASLPTAPEAPCAGSVNLGWSSATPSFACNAHTVPTASGRSIPLSYSFASVNGAATASCSNGSWSVQVGGTCATTYVPVTCPAQTINWTSGANMCSGTVPLTGPDTSVSVANTVSGLDGGQIMSCQKDGSWTTLGAGRCDTPPAPITDPVQLAQAKNCLACHAITGTGYSNDLPSFKRIADHYRGNEPAAGVLENKVKNGSSGVFGSLPMSANPQVSDSDLAILIPWILSR